jgi:hypothetical protein
MRARAVVKCRLVFECPALRSCSQAAISSMRAGLSGYGDRGIGTMGRQARIPLDRASCHPSGCNAIRSVQPAVWPRRQENRRAKPCCGCLGCPGPKRWPWRWRSGCRDDQRRISPERTRREAASQGGECRCPYGVTIETSIVISDGHSAVVVKTINNVIVSVIAK